MGVEFYVLVPLELSIIYFLNRKAFMLGIMGDPDASSTYFGFVFKLMPGVEILGWRFGYPFLIIFNLICWGMFGTLLVLLWKKTKLLLGSR